MVYNFFGLNFSVEVRINVLNRKVLLKSFRHLFLSIYTNLFRMVGCMDGRENG